MSYSAFSMDSPDTSHRIPELDGLRGIAILIVILFHARPEPASAFAPFPVLYKVFSFGPNGVDLFFVLSGFLITGILLDTKNLSGYFSSFYMRRALRILPVYFLAVAGFFYLMLPWVHSQGQWMAIASDEQTWYWTFLMNWREIAGHATGPLTHLWSLAVEEQFYLIWPLVVLACAARYFPALCAVVASLSLVLRAALVYGHFIAPELLDGWVYKSTITRMDTLAIGALVAVLVRHPEWAGQVRSWLKVIIPVCLTFYGLIATSDTLHQTFGYTLIAVVFGCVVLVCVMDEGNNHLLCRFARLAVLRSMGRYSYAMYVIHVAVIVFVKMAIINQMPHITNGFLPETPPLLGSLTVMITCIAVTYLVAFASWHLLEKRVLRLKDHFEAKKH